MHTFAISGTDLIQWISSRLKIGEEEHMEALQLAILLCHNGYIFPIADWRNLTVKEDASLYRFQVTHLSPVQHRLEISGKPVT